jgi:hypothetical protein
MADQIKKSLEEFLASTPDAPSAAVPFAGKEDGPDEEETPKAEMSPNPDSKKSDGPPAKTPPESGGKTETAPDAGSKSHDVEAIKKALREGDLELVGELLDEDPAGFDEKTPRWAARNRREAKLKAENAAVLEKAERIVARFSAVDTLLGRLEKGDFSALPELVEHVGQDWDSAAMKAFRSRRGADPRVPVLEARVAAAEAAATEGRTAAAKAADKLFFETLRDEVDSKHTVRKVDGWEQKVADVLRESVDETGDPRLSVKQAADRVVRREREEYERRAAVFGETPARRSRATTTERAAGATGTTKRKLTRDEWLAAQK